MSNVRFIRPELSADFDDYSTIVFGLTPEQAQKAALEAHANENDWHAHIEPDLHWAGNLGGVFSSEDAGKHHLHYAGDTITYRGSHREFFSRGHHTTVMKLVAKLGDPLPVPRLFLCNDKQRKTWWGGYSAQLLSYEIPSEAQHGT